MAKATPAETASQKRRYKERHAIFEAIKLAAGCADCGYKAHSAALDFDHVRGVKRYALARNFLRKLEDVLEEIKKCEVVCANCHRVRTAQRRNR